MSGQTLFPEYEFEALLEAWERFLDALLSSADKGPEWAVNYGLGGVPEAPPVTLAGGGR